MKLVMWCPWWLLLLLGGSPVLAGSTVTEYLHQGCRLLAGSQWDAAAAAFREAGSADAQCAVAWVGEGVAQLFAGFEEAGEASFTRALTLDDQLAVAYAGRATAAYLRGNLNAAWADYQAALASGEPVTELVRASAAHIACALGQYNTAETLAREALQLDPEDALARQVLASSALAGGRTGEVLDILSAQSWQTSNVEPGLGAPSALFAPECRYYFITGRDALERRIAARDRIEPSGRTGSVLSDRSGLTPGDSALYIIWPKSGTEVSGRLEIGVETAAAAEIKYIAVMFDGQFIGMTNTLPYRVWVDTTTVPEGLREVRVDGYGPDGAVTHTTSIVVNVQNSHQTLAPEEQQTREAVAEVLSRYVVLRADALQRAQLIGHALEAGGRLPEALDAYEYVFSFAPSLAGARADLDVVYGKLGLTRTSRPQEIHALLPGNHVALTFDDGPHPVLTPWILDLLDQYEAKATFFLVGRQAEMYPELTREIARRGHEIGGHSYTHANLRQLSVVGVERELVMSRLMLRRACGQFVTLFRPPGGNYDARVQAATEATGHTAVFWTGNIGTYPGQTGREILPKMLAKIGNNGIVLLHNGYDETREVLPLLLSALTNRGLRLDTISALSTHRAFRPEKPVFTPPDWVL